MRCLECNSLSIDTALSCAICGSPFPPASDERQASNVPVTPQDHASTAVAPEATTEAICDSCGAPMRAGRRMCGACERAFSSVLSTRPPELQPEPAPSREPGLGEARPLVALGPPDETACAGGGTPPPEPWWKAQRRQPAPSPPSQPHAPASRPSAAAPASPATAHAVVTATRAHPTQPSRPAQRVRPPRVTRTTSRRLVRPSLVAAAAVAVAIALGVPAGYQSGLLPMSGRGPSRVDVLSGQDPAVATVDGPATATQASPDGHRAEVTLPAPATAAAAEGSATVRKPSSRTTSRSRRATRPPASKEPASSEELPAAPIAEPLPVSPIAESAVLASTAPQLVSDRAEAVLAGPALEPSQVDVRPEVQSRVAPRLPGHLAGRQVEDVVILRVLVSPSGHATDARVLRTSKVDASLDDAAIEAVRQWRFTPARKGGRAVSCWFSVGVPMRGE